MRNGRESFNVLLIMRFLTTVLRFKLVVEKK